MLLTSTRVLGHGQFYRHLHRIYSDAMADRVDRRRINPPAGGTYAPPFARPPATKRPQRTRKPGELRQICECQRAASA